MDNKVTKNKLIKINNIKDFNNELIKYEKNISKLNIDDTVVENIYKTIEKGNITYRAKDIKDFIDYIEKIDLFEKEHEILCKALGKVKKIYINRLEYEREIKLQENVDHIMKEIEKINNNIFHIITQEEINKLEIIENEIDKKYIFAKDIELLKKMLIIKKEEYNNKTKIKTISLEIPRYINNNYIKPNKGTIEYHHHLNNSIPRIKRLTKNIYKYFTPCESDEGTFIINQSKTLQDSINISLAIFDNKEFKAISGNNEITDFCIAKSKDVTVFESSKVNRLGRLGIGYNRAKDSEKKILEEIHKQIEDGLLRDEGNLILYSKWEPCLSCYYVISQFCNKHPNIKVKIKYIKKYG